MKLETIFKYAVAYEDFENESTTEKCSIILDFCVKLGDLSADATDYDYKPKCTEIFCKYVHVIIASIKGALEELKDFEEVCCAGSWLNSLLNFAEGVRLGISEALTNCVA